MHANLMSPTGARNCANEAELIAGRCRSFEASFNREFGLCSRARSVNHLFEPDGRMLMLPLAIQRGVNYFVFPIRPAPNDREVFFAQLVSLHQQPKIACGRGGL